MEDIPEGLNENHSFIHIGIFMSGSLNSSGFMHLICMQLFRQKKNPKQMLSLKYAPLGEEVIFYSRRNDVAGIALSRQFLMFQKPER